MKSQRFSYTIFPGFNFEDAFEAATGMVAIENYLMEMLEILQIFYDSINDNSLIEEFLEEISVLSNLGATGGEMDIDLDAEIDPELEKELEKLPLYSLPETLSPKKITANSGTVVVILRYQNLFFLYSFSVIPNRKFRNVSNESYKHATF